MKIQLRNIFINVIVFILIINSKYLFDILILLYCLYFLFITIKNFEFALFLFFTLYPIRSNMLLLPIELSFDFSMQRYMVLVIISVFLINKYFIGRGVKYKNKTGFSNNIKIIIQIFILYDIMSSFFSTFGFLNNLNRSISFVFEIFIISYIYIKSINLENFKLLIYSFSIGCSMLLLSIIIERFFLYNPLLSFPISKSNYIVIQESIGYRYGLLRVRGSFSGSVQLSGFLPLVLMPFIYILSNKEKFYMKVYAYIMVFIYIIALYYSFSRTSIYTFIIFSFFYLILSKKKVKYILAIIFSLLFIYILFNQQFIATYNLATNPNSEKFEGSSTAHRINLWSAGLNVVLNNNFFGIGLYEDRSADLDKMDNALRDTANAFVSYGITKGIIYPFLLFLIIFQLIVISFKSFKFNNDTFSILLFSTSLSVFVGYFSYSEFYLTLPIIVILIELNNKKNKFNNNEKY